MYVTIVNQGVLGSSPRGGANQSESESECESTKSYSHSDFYTYTRTYIILKSMFDFQKLTVCRKSKEFSNETIKLVNECSFDRTVNDQL